MDDDKNEILERWKEILQIAVSVISNSDDNEVYYHYTTSEGVLGILEESALHMSDYRFLNDPIEFEHGLDFIKDYLGEIISSNSVKDLSSLLIESYRERIKLLDTKASMCIACFTIDNDSLTQWKGYSEFGKGFAIGFNREELVRKRDNLVSMLGPVRYTDEDKKEMIYSFLSKVAPILNGVKDLEEVYAGLLDAAYSLGFVLLSAYMKDEYYKEEREYRLFAMHDASNTKLKASRFGISPYSAIDLKNDEISNIVVGPLYDHEKMRIALCSRIEPEKIIAAKIKLQ